MELVLPRKPGVAHTFWDAYRGVPVATTAPCETASGARGGTYGAFGGMGVAAGAGSATGREERRIGAACFGPPSVL